MDNYAIAENFSLLSKLMDIHGENSFKAKSYASAAFNIEQLPLQLSDTPHDKIFTLKGIGESTGKKIIELLETGELIALKEMISKTPTGVIEMLNIKGIGPKKISLIWKEMEIETIGELLYACEENRLKLYKGFGEKTQLNVKENIEFYLRNQGTFLFAQVEIVFFQIKNYLEKLFSADAVRVTGAYRRQELTIDELEFVITASIDVIKQKMISANPPELLEEKENTLLYKLTNGLKLRFYASDNRDESLFFTTGSFDFIDGFKTNFPAVNFKLNGKDDTDRSFFEQANIQYVEAYLRENIKVIEKAKHFSIPTLIQTSDIKGIIHSHSNWSDGSNTVEEMANACIAKGFEYLVLSDHSKSAFYAKGLNEERIKEQHHYIDELNAKLAPFKIFKSIECDILNDGSLDYSNSVLSTFDLVIISVHSNLKMTEDKAMMRLLNAIENPYSTILGHLTGRLLLSRKGYPVDHKKIIDACAANHVAVELNAHPSRLDIDWKYIDYALEKGVLISIDPDAHEITGFDDIKYGVLAAQKAMVTKENNLSSFGLNEFEEYLKRKNK
ncbi:DNA polymerase/3'-5' exonuclease PolX [Ferruginibacter albus]|uniref:DNA polymerase/3'-5' exonuclease PolX n=1 Tax=Ferruginibacter albus TaxID=2875540 RepID=UPI001CC5B2A3|nr:DNA polymerase/3'-5' exonuclease PolX [Ferruginibacter albus]UAY52945.1 PHP domain-containing protein [Ferruginibacter albus]